MGVDVLIGPREVRAVTAGVDDAVLGVHSLEVTARSGLAVPLLGVGREAALRDVVLRSGVPDRVAFFVDDVLVLAALGRLSGIGQRLAGLPLLHVGGIGTRSVDRADRSNSACELAVDAHEVAGEPNTIR